MPSPDVNPRPSAATGVAISDLLTQIDNVKQQMTEADLRLGNAAHHAIAQ